MLSKKWFLTTFCLTLCVFGQVQAKYGWEAVNFSILINTDHYVLKDGRQVRLAGINGIDLNQPERAAACLTETLKINLPHQLLSSKLKIQKQPGQPRRPHVTRVYLKAGTKDMGLYLLRSGLATTKSSAPESYQKAQVLAQKSHTGIWGSCNPHLKLKKWEKENGRTPWFWDRYHTYLKTGAMGRVRKVLAGDLLELDNGLRIRLQGILVPETASAEASYQCFATQSQNYLEKLVLGKMIYLSDSPVLVSSYKEISRQVYLPQTKWRQAVWINEKMIADGYARWNPVFDDSYLKLAESKALEVPGGAWAHCSDKVLKEVVDTPAATPKPEVDVNCPIKGNISGSKKNPKKTYHTPYSGWYQRLEPEACFQTKTEAETAGFTKVK